MLTLAISGKPASAATLFSDGFEAGNFSAWSSVTVSGGGAAVVQQSIVRAGAHAARLSSTQTSGDRAYVRKSLSPAQADISTRGNFNVLGEGATGGNVPYIRYFNATGQRLVSLYRQNSNGGLWVAHSGGYHSTGRTIGLGAWHNLDLRAVVGSTGSGTVEVWMDGARVYTTSSASIGTAAVATVQLGNETSGQAFEIVADDILVSNASTASTATPTQAPGATATPAPAPTATAAPTPTSTAPSTQTPGSATLSPTDDAYVSGGQPSSNFGSAALLWSDASPVLESYLKFDLRSTTTTVSKATLRMWVVNGSGGQQRIKAVASNTWTEGTLTYNSRPAKGTTLVSFTPGSTTGVWREVDLTTAVNAARGSFLSLASDTSSSDGYDFNSAEASGNRVNLVLNWGGSAGPTPSATAAPAVTPTVAPTSAPGAGNVGYRDFQFSTGTSSPTAEKPQSKLWFHDGIWWGVLFNRSDFTIHRLNWATQKWSDTGVLVDSRNNTKADAMWTGTRLYVASAGPSASSSSDSVRVTRFSYNASTKTYSRDSGFPVTPISGGVEAIVLARDTTGRLWMTYTRNSRVLVTHTTSIDSSWITPYAIPVSGASNLTADDISAVIAYEGKIGVMWSNSNDDAMYFAIHTDGASDSSWTLSTAVRLPEYADDHMNLKSLEADSSGRVFAITKTSLTSSGDPLILLLVLKPNGSWTRHTFGRVSDDHTRPIVQIDEQNRRVYVFAASPCCSGETIYYKHTSLDSISFPTGRGTPFIQSTTSKKLNNPTSTKQNLNGFTNLVVVASDNGSDYYHHNIIDLP